MGTLWSRNMGGLWSRSQLNDYEAVLEMHSKQITSLSRYKLCIDHLFSDEIYNIGRIRVWFYVTQQVYPRLHKQEQQQCHETVCLWFAKFKQKCPEYAKELDHMRTTWDLNSHATQAWFSLSSDTDISTMNTVFVCVECGREFYAKAHLLRHTLVHKACKYCGKTSHHKCKHASSPNITKQDALKPFLHSYHYKMHLK